MATEAVRAFREALEEFGKIRLSINFLELFTTLIFTGVMDPKVTCNTFPIPPNATLYLNIQVPKDRVAISAEWRMAVDYDNALQLTVYLDSKRVMDDYNVVQAIYSNPISFFRIGAVVPVKDKILVIIRNKTANWVNLTLFEAYGEIDRQLFDALLNKYFATVTAEARR
jgi:hypothetical protein